MERECGFNRKGMADLSKLAYQTYRKRIVCSTSAFIIIKRAGHLIDKMKKTLHNNEAQSYTAKCQLFSLS